MIWPYIEDAWQKAKTIEAMWIQIFNNKNRNKSIKISYYKNQNKKGMKSHEKLGFHQTNNRPEKR